MTTDRYREYLASPDWARRRERIFQRDHGACRKCGAPAADVHHVTYERLFCELDDDLISLCAGCHELEHGKSGDADRQKSRQNEFQERQVRKLYR